MLSTVYTSLTRLFSILSLHLFVYLDYIISCLMCRTKVFTSLNFLPKLRCEFYILYVQYYFTNVYIAIVTIFLILFCLPMSFHYF